MQKLKPALITAKSSFYSKFYPNRKLVLREFEPQDAKRAKKLNRMASLASPNSWSEDYNISVDYIQRAYTQDNGSFLLARIRGKLVAMGGLQRRDEETAVLKKLRVHPFFRGRGLGKMLIEEREKIAENRGYKYVVAQTEVQNKPMQELLSKMGYLTDNEVHLLFGLQMYQFRKTLGGPATK